MRPALLALPVLAALAVPAAAAPSVSPETGQEAQLVLSSGGTSMNLVLLASTSSDGTRRLRALLSDSGNHELVRLSGALPASALRSSGGLTTLTTRVGGLPLTVVWRDDPDVVGVEGGDFGSNGQEEHGFSVVGDGGTATVRLGSARCTTTSVVVGRVVEADTNGYGEPLAYGLVRPSWALTCASPPVTTLP